MRALPWMGLLASPEPLLDRVCRSDTERAERPDP
jgi:hypothetical protein